MSDLTDLEICKRIAEIEGLKVASLKEVIARDYREDTCIILPRKNEHCSRSYSYDPLTDDALCFRLMVKYGVLRWSKPRPHKSICLSIIKANSND